MKKVSKFKGLAAIFAMIMMLTCSAWAGTSTTSYNTTVGKYNGSGYSSYQTKSISGANGWIYSEQVGGKYVVDVRMNSTAGNAPWLRNVTDGTSSSLPGVYKQNAGDSIRLKFSNDVNTPVNVQVIGTWKSN
jgi:hypothetical protein